jgi:hypothetical protein
VSPPLYRIFINFEPVYDLYVKNENAERESVCVRKRREEREGRGERERDETRRTNLASLACLV